MATRDIDGARVDRSRDAEPTQARMMKAMVQDGYGGPGVLRLAEVEVPKAGDHEVLVRMHASSVNPYDWHFMTGEPYLARLLGRSMGMGFRKPLHPTRGWDVAGTIEEVGKDVDRFKVGDAVFGWSDGAFAEYVCAGEDHFVTKPEGITFEQAAAIPMAALTALQALRDHGDVQPGQEVLVNGASGGVGTFAVQLAKSFGAHVTGVCSPTNLEMVRSIGADRVIDYTREDFTAAQQRYDLIVDPAMSRSLAEYRNVLNPGGAYVAVGGTGGRWLGGFERSLQIILRARVKRHRLRTFTVNPTTADLEFIRELINSGAVTPMIDRTYPLDEVPAALGYVLDGHARSKVIVTI